jgi:TolA-binding protein
MRMKASGCGAAGQRLLFVILPLLFFLVGCESFGPAEREALVQASNAYARGDAQAASAKLDRLIKDFGRAPEVAEAHYLRGLCRMKMSQAPGAARDFEDAIRTSRREDLTALARASLASIAFQNGDWSRAADLYAQSVRHLPDQPPTDQILYNAGVSLQRVGRWREAAFQFSRIVDKFPGRPLAADARRMLGWRHEYFTIQLAAFANPASATTAVEQFRARGLDAVQENQARDGGALWVIMTGRYTTHAEASTALARVRQVEPGAFIIPQM